jgi:hypothetical protein
LEKQLPIHIAAERGHVACVQELLAITKPGGKALHEELWTLAIKNSQRELISWLHDDLCSFKDLPKNLFPAGTPHLHLCFAAILKKKILLFK